MMRRFWLRLLNVIRRDAAEQDLAREIASHLKVLEDGFVSRGLSARDARLAARRAFGGVEQTKEQHRDARSFVWLDDCRRDLSHAIRLMRRSPVATATAAISLAVAIGSNTAVFTAIDAAMLSDPVGIAAPGSLIDIGVARDDGGLANTSYPTYLDIRRRASTLDGVYAHPMFPHAMSLVVSSGAGAERVFGHFVSINYFNVLGAWPSAGRLFGSADGEQPGASPLAVLAYGFWTRRFNRDPSVIGKTFRFNDQPFTVVGVAPEGFQGTGIMSADVWLPLEVIGSDSARQAVLSDRKGGWLAMGGRLKAGVPVAQAAAEIEELGRALDREFPDPAGARGLRVQRASRFAGNSGLIATFLAVLATIALLVLAVACANVGGILLARATSRRREMAVRLAVGAGRGRLIRQLLAETMLLFLIGAGGGLLLARGLTAFAAPLVPSLPFPVAMTLSIDRRVIAFTTALALVASIASGLTPALRASRAVAGALKDEGSGVSARSRLRGAFVMAQVAISLLLVVTAGMFVRALQRAGSLDPGFDARGVELASVDLSMGGYDKTSGPPMAHDLVERVRRLPQVQAATLARVLPSGFEGIGLGGVTVPGFVAPGGGNFLVPAWNIVEPGYFATLRIALAAGRDFTDADRAGTQPVVVVGERVARTLWPGRDPIGQFLLKQGYGPNGPTPPEPLLVVGVARDVKSSSLIDGLAESFVYLPLQQQYDVRMTSLMTIVARSTDGRRIAEDLRALVAAKDLKLPILTSQTLEDAVTLGVVPQRVLASFAGILGTIGLLLAAFGIYGVTAFTVAQRTREFGIRIALGAQRGQIFGIVIRHGLVMAAIGSVIGLVLAAGVSRVLAGFLFGLSPFDPTIFGSAAALFVAAGLVACWGPARRAFGVDPIVALRDD